MERDNENHKYGGATEDERYAVDCLLFMKTKPIDKRTFKKLRRAIRDHKKKAKRAKLTHINANEEVHQPADQVDANAVVLLDDQVIINPNNAVLVPLQVDQVNPNNALVPPHGDQVDPNNNALIPLHILDQVNPINAVVLPRNQVDQFPPNFPHVECLRGQIGLYTVPCEKVLTLTDVNPAQARLQLPKGFYLAHCRPMLRDNENMERGIAVKVYVHENDLVDGDRVFDMKFKVWADKLHVLCAGWKSLVDTYRLTDTRDTVVVRMFRHTNFTQNLGFVITFIRN
ncbi:hypothetical protein ACFE04_022317 [Oxalis oulophora]